jgi:hypothetical protein
VFDQKVKSHGKAKNLWFHIKREGLRLLNSTVLCNVTTLGQFIY